jgi:hypothetical protein
MKKTLPTVLILGLALGLGSADAWAQATAQKHGEEGHGRGPNVLLRGTYTFRLVPATSFAPFFDGTNGKDSGVVAAPRQDVLRVGTLTFDGNGGFAGHTIATTDDGLTTVVIDFTTTGTYTLNPDGTGSLAVTAVSVTDASCLPAQTAGACATFEGPETYAFVLNSHAADKLLSLIETDNEGGGAKIFLTGDAKKR